MCTFWKPARTLLNALYLEIDLMRSGQLIGHVYFVGPIGQIKSGVSLKLNAEMNQK